MKYAKNTEFMLQLLSRLPSSHRPSLTNLAFSVSNKTEHFISKCFELRESIAFIAPLKHSIIQNLEVKIYVV
jgi:hypothetical protein